MSVNGAANLDHGYSRTHRSLLAQELFAREWLSITMGMVTPAKRFSTTVAPNFVHPVSHNGMAVRPPQAYASPAAIDPDDRGTI